MPYLIIPSRRTRQPQGAVVLLPEFRDSVVDVGFQKTSVLDGAAWSTFGTAPTFDAGPQGLRTNQLAAFGGLVRTGLANATASQVLLFSGYVTTRSGAYAGLIARSQTGGGGASLTIQREGTDGNWRIYHAGNTEMPNGVINPDEPFTLVISAIGGKIYPYVNGSLWGSVITASAATTTLSRIVVFGESAASASYSTKGVCYVRGAWNKGWPPEVAREVSINPWRIFAPDPRRLYFGTGAGGDTYSLTATGLTGGTPALQSAALTQNHVVTASNIAGTAPTLGSPALSQNHALTANNLAGTAPTLGTPAVTLAGTLVANDITGAAPVLANAVLTQNHALTATAIGGTAATLGTPALTQNHVVTAANLTGAAPVLGTPTVVLGGTLLADNILGATPTLGSPTLTQNHALTASPLLGAAPILGSPAFGQNHLLTGSNIVGAAPQLGAPALSLPQDIALQADSIVGGYPLLGAPGMSSAPWTEIIAARVCIGARQPANVAIRASIIACNCSN